MSKSMTGYEPAPRSDYPKKVDGKSTKLGHGGRAAELKKEGVPGGVIGKYARRDHAAPGQKNYHGK